MGKFYFTLIGIIGLLSCYQACWAQCPDYGQVTSQRSSLESFETGEGEVIFTISGQSFHRESYRIRLWEDKTQRYVYDDNAPAFLNKPLLNTEGPQISFTQLTEGNYTLELHGGECTHQMFKMVPASTDQAI